MVEKRGDLLSPAVIIGLIVVIASFAIILSLLFRLDLIGQSDDEICRLSVLSRASVWESTQGLLPLKCSTKKICLGLGDECSQFVGEENVKTIKLPKGNDASSTSKAARMIEKTSAESMYNCWDLMGQGKLDLFSGSDASDLTSTILDVGSGLFGVSGAKPVCFICSRIALSEELEKRRDILSKVDMARYLATEKPTPESKKTYLQLFTDEQVRSYPGEIVELVNSGSETVSDEIAYVFMQVLAKGEPLDEAVRTGTNTGILVGGSLFLGPVGRFTNFLGLGVLFKVGTTAVVSGLAGGFAYYQTGKNQDFAVQHCGQFASGETENGKLRKGCSIVKPVDYNDVNTINQLCYRIEGNL